MEKNPAPEADCLPDKISDDVRDVWGESHLARPEPGGFDENRSLPSGRSSTIAEVAHDFGLSIRTLRFYEERGLLHPRRAGNARYYSARDRLHLKMILKGKQLGFTLTEIRDILASRAEEAAGLGTRESGRKAARGFQDEAWADYGGADPAQIDLAKIDLAMGLRPEQIAAQIEHLERQRQQVEEALSALREAQRRRCTA